MAITQTQNLPAPFIQGLGEEYAKGLGALTGTAMPTAQFAPAVAAQDPLQQQAATLAGQIGGVPVPLVIQNPHHCLNQTPPDSSMFHCFLRFLASIHAPRTSEYPNQS